MTCVDGSGNHRGWMTSATWRVKRSQATMLTKGLAKTVGLSRMDTFFQDVGD